MTIRQDMQRGNARPARVTALYLQNGVPVVDVCDSYGNTSLACRFTCMGGGGARFLYSGPVAEQDEQTTPEDSQGAQVLIQAGDGSIPHVTVTGALINPQAFARFGEIEAPAEGSDYDPLNSLRDLVAENNGARFMVSEFGLIVLDTTGTQEPVFVQLASSSYLRISQDGTASERLLLAGPTRSVIDGLVSRVNALGAQVAALSALIQPAAVVAAAVNVVSPGTGGAAFLAAWATVGNDTPHVAQLALPFQFSDAAPTGDDMVASAVRISAQSKAEE
jgi:hypothetical protein